MDVVLEKNNFCFNNKHFIQTEGTAIVSKIDRNYACVYMDDLQRFHLERTMCGFLHILPQKSKFFKEL